MKYYSYKDIAELNPFTSTDWKHYFFQYMCGREGFLLDVYKDIYGYYTVGIGHLIVASDNIPKVAGYKISKQDVVRLFLKDMVRLRIDFYTSEIFNPNPFKKIGLASFLWAHGDGDYKNGETRKLISTTDNEAVIRSKISTWDKAKPANQVRNKADFDMFFTGVSKHASGLFDFRKFFDFIKTNPGTTGTVALGGLLLFFF